MAKDDDKKQAVSVEVKASVDDIEVELLHPITHDGVVFGRGVHKLEKGLAALFLTFKDAVSKKPIAQIPQAPEVAKGTVEKDPSAKEKK